MKMRLSFLLLVLTTSAKGAIDVLPTVRAFCELDPQHSLCVEGRENSLNVRSDESPQVPVHLSHWKWLNPKSSSSASEEFENPSPDVTFTGQMVRMSGKWKGLSFQKNNDLQKTQFKRMTRRTRRDTEMPFPFGISESRSGRRTKGKDSDDLWENDDFSPSNNWGFDSSKLSEEKSEQNLFQDEKILLKAYRNRELSLANQMKLKTTTPQPEVEDPNYQGLLKDIGGVGVSGGVGVGEYASVGVGVGLTLGRSGLAGGLPESAKGIFPPQGESLVLDDYTGNKRNIVPDRWRKYWIAVSEGRASPPPKYKKPKTLVGVSGGVGVGR